MRCQAHQLVPGVFGRLLHRFALAVNNTTAAAWTGEGRHVRVPRGHNHLAKVQAQGFGGNLGQRGVAAGNIHGPGQQADGAILVNVYGGGGRAAAAAPLSHGDADAPVFAELLGQTHPLLDGFHGFPQAVRGQPGSANRGIAL